ncbi:MAG: hypothetical protein V7K92_12670 [Nostoc sp.]|uniref:hypothetical protein n=1 Tax=Nostoc sp. TaxID=1180 RepID=UPI002FF29E30
MPNHIHGILIINQTQEDLVADEVVGKEDVGDLTGLMEEDAVNPKEEDAIHRVLYLWVLWVLWVL